MFLKYVALLLLLIFLAIATVAQDVTATPSLSNFPVTIESCGEAVTFDKPPQQALVFDTNMTEIMLALGLEERIIGYWISGAAPISEQYEDQIDDIPLISEKLWPPPGMEIILSFEPDFVFGGWGYSFSEEWGVTPERLSEFGIRSYELSETCLITGTPPDETLEGTFQDILNIGLIFGVEETAQQIVDQMRDDIASVQEIIGEVDTPIRVFYYGGGEDTAFTAGRYAMPTRLMRAAGAENIFSDVEADWIPEASWESVIERDPEVIIIDDTPWANGPDSIATLKSLPQLADVTAIREERFIVVPWTYILPSVDIDESITMLAENFYPEMFVEESEETND